MYASDMFQRVATEAVQIHGAYGVSDEFSSAAPTATPRSSRSSRAPNELHRTLIAREILSAASRQRP